MARLYEMENSEVEVRDRPSRPLNAPPSCSRTRLAATAICDSQLLLWQRRRRKTSTRAQHILCWIDPYWHNNTLELQGSDIISCIYVLNMIENSTERIQVLQLAWELAKRSLILAVRNDGKGEGTTSQRDVSKILHFWEFSTHC